MKNWLASFVVAILLAVLPAASAFGQTYTVNSATTVSLGNVAAAASGTTTFTINPATGAITTSGSGGLIGSVTGRSLVTVSCANGGPGNNCNSFNVAITVASTGTPTGRAGALQNFTVSTTGATAVTVPPVPSSGNPLTFTIQPIQNNQSRTFYIGFDFPINSTGSTGSANSSFSVTASRAGGGTSVPGSGSATANVFRAISLSKTADLSFGKIIRPSTGSGTVTLSAAGVRTVTGTGAVAIASPAPTRAAFSVSGEGGQAVTVTIPATFTMTSGANTLTVTTASTGGGAQTLSSNLGNAGSNPTAINVGGSFPMTSATPTGAYTGTFTVTVQYN
jgi:hypothetical protein